MEGNVSALTDLLAVKEKTQIIKAKIDAMLTASSQSELLGVYTDIMSELGMCYTSLTNQLENQNAAETLQDSETEVVNGISEEADSTVKNDQNEANNDVTEDVVESPVENAEETNETSVSVEEEAAEEAAYAVFYSVNHAAYVAINERMRACVPVRNLAKAFCVPADLTSVAQGQNELSKYKLDKMKPIQIKFLTQKEYDDTIGKAKSMQALLANMPQSTNTTISGDHKVTNFAANNKSTAKGHIGEKPKNSSCGYWDKYDYSSDKYDDYRSDGSRKTSYDFFRSQPYYGQGNKSHSQTAPSTSGITMTDMIECPRELYKAMHDGIDDTSEVCKPHSYENDIIQLSQATYDQMGDFEILIPMINKTVDMIADTRAGWLVDPFIASGKVIDNDYMMDIDYALLDTAIEEWNEENKPFKVMYVEDFDPTIISFKKNIETSAKKYGQNYRELAAMAVYNYVRCIMAYESFKVKHGIIN